MGPSSVERQPSWVGTPLWYSVLRSVVTPHVVFTFVVLSAFIWGVSLAPETDWPTTIVLLVAFYLGLEGMHDIDLADPTIAVTLDPTVQRRMGYVLVVAGSLLGVYAAYRSTWGLIAFVAIEVVVGFAYNGEWFDGLFHDIEKLGAITAAVSLGAVPVLTGYYSLAHSITLEAVLWAVVASLLSVGILHLYQTVKVPVLYERMWIEADREMEISDAKAYERVTDGLVHVIAGYILMGIAFVVTGL